MSIQKSVLAELLQALPNWRPQMYFKASLTALSHAMEDRVLVGEDRPLAIASFQRERFYRQEAHRYRRIAQKTDQVYVLCAPETDFKNSSGLYETIAFEPTDSLAREWHLVVIGEQYSSCLICRERTTTLDGENRGSAMDNSRRFEGIWTFDRQVSQEAAAILLDRILAYRPELAEKIERARHLYLHSEVRSQDSEWSFQADPFVQRLVTYLQAGQYKLIKANRSLASKEHKERLINSVTAAIRRSLDPQQILQVAVQKLGEGLGVCRCIIYRCDESDATAKIEHEFLNAGITSIKGQAWPLKNNPLFEEVLELRESISIDDAFHDPRIVERANPNAPDGSLQKIVKNCSIFSWLLVPILYQGRLLGMVELHHCGPTPSAWKSEDIALVDAIATQVGVALIQAEAYANLQDLNEQLEALDRTRSNLVAITGHELRTPLSTIQVCLESLASEPDMSPELRQVMLNTALADAERMRKLIQDFLTLSQLESGRVEWHPEPLSLNECVELALSHLHARNAKNDLPKISNLVPQNLPLVEADGEWLVEVLTKLLDNACKFTGSDGQVTVEVSRHSPQSLEVTIADTGRGIEPNRLKTVFDRFYQEEGALRRSVGGTGLGLAICRQIVNGWGGAIWAESEGKNHGSQFHFTVPIVSESSSSKKSQDVNGQSSQSSPSQKQQRSPRKRSRGK
ncbi:histidine kinase [Hydrococcus rivularis NIES-593]|uniref:histidine kinase n=1 Tax=Hydrococcus rivularis NIES-593 TaxID=1921803 RepID=A0A1U7HMN1_9CYAN|nr:DICT sensory domain-containing protein [Hydrococcus rivularis]OKH24852.1 histidine kinase [Hydrococcus rivularis NIES-593]